MGLLTPQVWRMQQPIDLHLACLKLLWVRLWYRRPALKLRAASACGCGVHHVSSWQFYFFSKSYKIIKRLTEKSNSSITTADNDADKTSTRKATSVHRNQPVLQVYEQTQLNPNSLILVKIIFSILALWLSLTTELLKKPSQQFW